MIKIISKSMREVKNMTFQDLMNAFYVNSKLNNTVVYEKLAEQLKRDRITPVIGAGLSVWAGYPLWGNLIRDLAEGTDYEKQVADCLKKEEYEQAASFLEKAYNPNTLMDTLKEEFSPKKLDESKRPEYQKLLPQLFKGPFVTTNFDVSLERLLHLSSTFVVNPQDEFYKEETINRIQSNQPFLVKLHGTIDDPQHMVFTKNSYDLTYGKNKKNPDETKPLPQQLETIFHAAPPLFLGCSLGSDRTCRVFEKCKGTRGFALLGMPKTDEEFNKRRTELDKMGIKVIWYPKGCHDAVEVLIRQLAIDMGIDPDMPVIDKKMTVQEQQYKNSVNFLGREEIVQEIFGYMNDPDTPAVIVNGPAGIGKTEICKAVYWKLKSKISDFSMPFIDLAGFSADDVIPSIAKALEIFREDVSPERLFEMLKSFLTGNKKTYYVYLDNFEAVWNEAESKKADNISARLGTLTRLGLKLLISSQASLTLGKKVKVRELDSDKHMETMSFEEILETDSGKLFVKTFGEKPKTYEQDSFITLMREIDGHPLSIILTATYCRQRSINKVKNKWSAIEATIPDSAERETHKSLMCALGLAWQQVSKSKAAVFIWALHTYSIYPLDDDILLELNEFAGKPFSEDDLTDGQDILRNYGLIDMTDDGKAHMLLCIKKNLEHLDETGDVKSEIESAFSSWIKWCSTLLKRGDDRKDKEYIEYHNRALEWLPECFSLAEYCLDKQKYDELRILLDDAHNYYQFDVVRSVPLLTRLTQEVPGESALQSSWYVYLGDILRRTGNLEGALQAYYEAERLYRKENVNLGLANVLKSRGDLLSRTGNLEGALKAYDEAERLARQEHDDLGLANVLKSRGDLLSRTGKQEEALQAYDEAERLYRKENVNLGLANVLHSRGDLLSRTGKQEEALQAYYEAERLYRKENVDLGLANVLSSKGDLLMNSKNVSDAKICYEKALDLYRDEQILEFVGYALFDLIICCAQLDDKNGLETYTRELQQILPLLPEHTKKSINKTFTMFTNRNTTS